MTGTPLFCCQTVSANTRCSSRDRGCSSTTSSAKTLHNTRSQVVEVAFFLFAVGLICPSSCESGPGGPEHKYIRKEVSRLPQQSRGSNSLAFGRLVITS